MKKLGKWLYLFLFVGYFLVLFVMQNASIYGLAYPFAIGFMFALIWAEQKVWLVCPAFFLSSIAFNFSFESVIIALVACIMIALPFYIHIVCKKRIRKWELGIYCLLGQVASIAFSAVGGVHPAVIVVAALVCVLFMYTCIHIFEPILVRGFAYKLTTLETICGALILVVLSDGLAAFDIYGYSILKTFVVFLLLTISYTTKSTVSCLVAGVLGLGTMLGTNNPIFIAPFILWALGISCFKTKQRILPFLAVILVDIFLGFVCKLYYSYGLIDIASVVVGSVIFLFLPSKFYNSISTLLAFNGDRLASKNLLNRSREMLYRHISNLSEVFCDMDEVFKKLIKKGMTPEEAKSMLYEEIKGDICRNCPEKGHCHRTFASDTKAMIEELFTIAMERGKITLLDIPSYLTSRCNKVNALINEINTLSNQYKSYSSLVANVDNSKLLISDQLNGVSLVLKNLANETQANISFDTARENRIIDELAMNNILCTDAVVYERDNRTFSASLIIRDEDVNRPKIPEVVGKACGCKMGIVETYPTERVGLFSVNLSTAPRYDCLFGLSSCNKAGSNISGDCHSVIRLDSDRFLFALCDGMGSGERAGEKSETTISLIENFYKAGFDNDIILSSVNKLLNLERDDVFSTIDVCVVDLKNGIADFVKMGSPASLIRQEDGCVFVGGGALPVGVLQEAKASTQKAVLREKDMIVLCSDGISDAFASDNEFKDFVLSIKSANPQEFSDKILERALAGNNGYAVDDMTCLVIKIFQP